MATFKSEVCLDVYLTRLILYKKFQFALERERATNEKKNCLAKKDARFPSVVL